MRPNNNNILNVTAQNLLKLYSKVFLMWSMYVWPRVHARSQSLSIKTILLPESDRQRHMRKCSHVVVGRLGIEENLPFSIFSSILWLVRLVFCGIRSGEVNPNLEYLFIYCLQWSAGYTIQYSDIAYTLFSKVLSKVLIVNIMYYIKWSSKYILWYVYCL